MERKSSVKDVHKLIGQDYPELYKALCEKLGESNPFAKFNIGVGCYVWSDNRCKWHCMIDASELKQSMIVETLCQVKIEVAGMIGQKTAEVLFTTPDDSFIYFNEDNGNVKILVTGWGFNKPVRVVAKPDAIPVNQKNPIKLSFSYDGDHLKDYEFGLRLAKQIKRLKTDSSGFYVFDNLKVGENYVVTDINSNRNFNLNIREGQSSYDFDVTDYSTLEISALSDGQPLAEEEARIDYHEKKYTLKTDENGHAAIQLPLYEGEVVIASMKDKIENTPMTKDGGKINFIFETEKSVESNRVNIKISVMRNGEMLPSQPVTIDYGGKYLDGVTDSNGIFSVQIEEIPDELCNVNTPGYESQSKWLNSKELNEFVFNKIATPNPPADVFNPYILLQRENGENVGNYPISVEYDGTKTSYVSNTEGIVALSNMKDGEMMKVIDGIDSDNVADYLLDKEQKEYVFIIPNKQEDEQINDIKVMFREVNGKPITCDNVKFCQEGKPDLLVQLDENGDTYFKEGTFDVGLLISTHINGWKNKELYSPIPFSLENNEYEYLLQEKEAKKESIWWRIIFEILVVLLTIALLWLLWPFFEDFCQRMFESIYY